MKEITRLRAVDSHTGGEPTRVVVEGFPALGRGSIAQRLEIFRSDHDHLRSAIVREPRGHDAIVGALVCELEETLAIIDHALAMRPQTSNAEARA